MKRSTIVPTVSLKRLEVEMGVFRSFRSASFTSAMVSQRCLWRTTKKAMDRPTACAARFVAMSVRYVAVCSSLMVSELGHLEHYHGVESGFPSPLEAYTLSAR